MKNLLLKEFKLALHPTCLIFLGLSFMLIIPNYPYYVTFFYTSLAIFFTCLSSRENNDIYYMMLLPIRKRHIVTARVAMTVLLQTAQALVAAAVVVLRNALMDMPNLVGMDANIAFFGLSFAMMGLFNLTFFTKYYRDPSKPGRAFLVGCVFMFLYIAAAETAAHALPFVRDFLDTPDPQFLSYKLAALAAGLVCYALLTLLAHKKAVKSFEGLDL